MWIILDYLGKRTGTPELLSVCLQLSLQSLYSAMFLQGAINHIQASRVVHLAFATQPSRATDVFGTCRSGRRLSDIFKDTSQQPTYLVCAVPSTTQATPHRSLCTTHKSRSIGATGHIFVSTAPAPHAFSPFPRDAILDALCVLSTRPVSLAGPLLATRRLANFPRWLCSPSPLGHTS